MSRLIPFRVPQLLQEMVVEKNVDGILSMMWKPKMAPSPLINDFDISTVGTYVGDENSSNVVVGDNVGRLTAKQFEHAMAFVAQQKKTSPHDIFFWLKDGSGAQTSCILIGLKDACGGAGTCLACHNKLQFVPNATLRVVGTVRPIMNGGSTHVTNFLIARSARIVHEEAKTVQVFQTRAVRERLFHVDSKNNKSSHAHEGIKASSSSTTTTEPSWTKLPQMTQDARTVFEAAVAFGRNNPSAEGVLKSYLADKSTFAGEQLDNAMNVLDECGLLFCVDEDTGCYGINSTD